MSHNPNIPEEPGQLDLIQDQLNKTTYNADQIINIIADTLAEADGEFIERIANEVLASKVTYLEDSIFEMEDPNWDEL